MSSSTLDKEYLITLLKDKKRAIVQDALVSSGKLVEYDKIVEQINQLHHAMPTTQRQTSLKVVESVPTWTPANKVPVKHPNASTRDSGNSLAAEAKHGERTLVAYNKIEEIVKGLGGEASLSDIKDHLEALYDTTWTDFDGRGKDSRIASTIATYANLYPDNITLDLLPKAKPGHKRVRKYERVRYIGKEVLSV